MTKQFLSFVFANYLILFGPPALTGKAQTVAGEEPLRAFVGAEDFPHSLRLTKIGSLSDAPGTTITLSKHFVSYINPHTMNLIEHSEAQRLWGQSEIINGHETYTLDGVSQFFGRKLSRTTFELEVDFENGFCKRYRLHGPAISAHSGWFTNYPYARHFQLDNE